MQVVNFSHLSNLSALLSPLHTLVAWLIRPASTQPRVPPAKAALSHQRLTLPIASAVGSRSKNTTALVSSFKSATYAAQNHGVTLLKVVREHDAGVGPSCAGRMTISGRMADVCAELDRMTQRGAAS